MREIFLRSLVPMEAAFRRLESHVPRPRWQQVHGNWVWRYAEQTAEQALVQKLARYISGLHATDVLLASGFVQEQMLLQRTLDEIHEDVMFLALGVIQGLTPVHERYLTEFWKEEFDNPDPGKSSQKRAMLPRKSIRSYIAGASSLSDPHAFHSSGNVIYKTFSGYLHGASPQIMDMVGGTPSHPEFHINGMRGTPRIREAMLSAWNYFLRGFMSLTIAAKAFGDARLVEALYQAMGEFEKTDPGADP